MTVPTEVVTALIGVGGLIVGATVQWLVARYTIRSETERLHRKLRDEFHLQQFSMWQSQFQTVIGELLTVTDPETNQQFQKEQIIPLVLRAELLLNPRFESHAKVSNLVTRLALMVNGWHGPQDLKAVLAAHNELLIAAREILYLPAQVRQPG